MEKINSYGVEFLASNDTYFDKVIRGPEFERRKKEEEAKSLDFKVINTIPVTTSGPSLLSRMLTWMRPSN